MKTLLIVTTNPGKFEEADFVLWSSGLNILGLKDFPRVAPVEETGATFEENAILKEMIVFDAKVSESGGFA